jgi:hypothetical protein
MRFQANPDDIKSLVATRLNLPHIFYGWGNYYILVKTKTNKRLDDKKSPVDFSLTRNEPAEKTMK